MKAIHTTIAAAFCVTLFSCGNSDNKTKNNDGINIDAVTNSNSTNPNAKGDNKCLLGYQQKYDALLSESDLIAATGFSKDVMKTDYSKALSNPEYHDFEFQFRNKRIGKVPMSDHQMEVSDVVKISSIKPISTTGFKDAYRAVTDEEMQAANDALSDITESNNNEADAAMKQAKKQGVGKEQIKKTGGALTNAFKEVSKGYRTVSGLGDGAVWNIVTQELTVLQNGVQFELLADISNDNEKNKSAAITLAKIILNKCK